ncbi:MAG: adenylate/guanylate cyclase domain-containing protein [Candidatus Acidiferrales bacterium]
MPLITMVFTDVVESSATKRDTSLGRDNRERDRAYLEKVQTPHFELVRAICQSHGGREVSTMGDAFFLAFADPTQAVRCAVNIQQRLAEKTIETPRGALRLRIGIHSGFPEYFENSWHGTDVDTAARVEAAATANQILMSSRTYELVRQMTDIEFYPQGEFALKGVDRMALWEVAWDAKGPRRTATPPREVGRRRKRNLRIAGAVAGTLLALASVVYLYLGYKSHHFFTHAKPRPAVAVMDFKNLGKPNVEWLSNALSEMLSTELGSTDALRTVFPEDVSTARADLALSVVPSFNSATLSKIRRILHSEYVVSGAYVAMGNEPNDSIHVDVHVQDADSGETVASFGEDGTIATLHEVLSKAGAELCRRFGVQAQQENGNLEPMAALPSDPEALRLYTDGLARLRAFDALGARDSLQRSIALAPDFALPHFALARAWKLLGYDEQARSGAKKAVELSGNLPPRDQRFIEAEYHELNSQWDQAIAIYQALGLLYRDEPNYAPLLANAQTSAGKGQEALGTLAALAKDPQMKDDPRVDLYVALAAESLSDVHKQRDAAESAAEKATRQESRLLAAHAYGQLCGAYYALGEFQKGEAACNSSKNSAPFDDEITARTQTVLSNIMLAQGRTLEALEMRQQALDTARKIGSQKDRFRRSRDDGRFALTTLQNPTLEVRSRSELIVAAQKTSRKKPARRGGTPSSPMIPPNKIPLIQWNRTRRDRIRQNLRHNNARQEKTHFQSAWRSALNRRVKWNFAMSWAKTSLLPSPRSATPPPAPGSPSTSRRNVPKLPWPPQPNPPPPRKSSRPTKLSPCPSPTSPMQSRPIFPATPAAAPFALIPIAMRSKPTSFAGAVQTRLPTCTGSLTAPPSTATPTPAGFSRAASAKPAACSSTFWSVSKLAPSPR